MRIVFMGTPAIAVPSLQALASAGHEIAAVFCQPDKPAGRGKTLSSPPIKLAAQEMGIPVLQPSKMKTEETRSSLAELTPEAVVVFAYGRILPPSLLSVPPRGCINVHTSLLPKYRGAAPIQWAIARGETETGVTTMLMDEGLDTGPMLLRRAIPIGPTETASQLSERLSQLGAEMIVSTLDLLDELVPEAQDNSQATLAPILKREDGLIDWTMYARDIANRCRGFDPWPGTWTTRGGLRLQLWVEATSVGADAPAGSIIKAKGDDLIVACGAETVLRVIEGQLEGKRRMSARDLINGARITAGTVLGG